MRLSTAYGTLTLSPTYPLCRYFFQYCQTPPRVTKPLSLHPRPVYGRSILTIQQVIGSQLPTARLGKSLPVPTGTSIRYLLSSTEHLNWQPCGTLRAMAEILQAISSIKYMEAEGNDYGDHMPVSDPITSLLSSEFGLMMFQNSI